MWKFHRIESQCNLHDNFGVNNSEFFLYWFWLDRPLKITFISGEAYLNYLGGDCDDKGNDCDSYILLFIDHYQVYKTKVVDNENHPPYNEVYASKTPISMDSIVQIKMGDDDGGKTNDDFMDAWFIKPSDIDGTQKTYYGIKTKPSSDGIIERMASTR